jgi:hypothetical protein
VTISNAAPNGVVTMNTVTSNLFNEKKRSKSADINSAHALITENREELNTDNNQEVVASSEAGQSPKEDNATIVVKKVT